MTAPCSDGRLSGDGGRIDDQAADAKAKKQQRRKIQNRKNQRARRLRREEKTRSDGQDQRPYQVERWRVDEIDASPPTADLATPVASDEGPKTLSTRPVNSSIDTLGTTVLQRRPVFNSIRENVHPFVEINFPLSTDHLIHIIQYNVLRGLKANKTAFNILTGLIDPSTPMEMPCYHGKSRLPLPAQTNGPSALMPTALQVARAHSTWIDMIPFPRVRDNLIRWENFFDHSDFLQDLIGELGVKAPFIAYTDDDCWSRIPAYTLSVGGSSDQELTSRHGLVVWGEPHDIRNWELTPGFLTKWMWVLDGCEELIEISNRWRRVRGEEPMRLEPMEGNLVQSIVGH